MRKPFPRLSALPSSAAIAAMLFAGSMLVQLPSVRAAGPADADSREITRLINGARAAVGKPALKVDVFLASKARDGSIPCPDDASRTIPGRSRDFASYGQMSHQLRLCGASGYALSDEKFVTTMQKAWGYGSVGEILLVNGGYGNGEFLYTYKGWSTWTYATTGNGMMGWATSSAHWNIVMGSYDRVGCGAWSPSGSTIYYACLFSAGGPSPSGLAAAAIASPFNDPLPTPAPTRAPVATPAPIRTPAPVAATSRPVVAATKAPANPGNGAAAGNPTGQPTDPPSPSATQSRTPSATPDATSSLSPAPSLTETAGPTAPARTTQPEAAANTDSRVPPPSGSARQNASLVAESAAAAWFGLLGLLVIQRRRRRRHSSMATA